MTTQIIFSITYVPFVIFIAMSCLYEGRTAIIFKILSAVCAVIATISYIFFIKSIL
ncbi:uncharacterized protein METZ01_LOCUS383284 [marine metagenome]|uniref:Uncharacterized protein n=1 Tax=marine metagenome TaxID=408172 RepID=A0A382U814_9ZZZZ